ncbi:MAG: ABC transporter ATP-binding protein [Ruminococcaceae bacterium]|nr:ABC transporter ATP-binding protein [Oscillospiraceae bacterium]
MSIVSVEDLKKYYTVYDNETHALDGVSFSVEKGQFVAVIGTSGSGKSTLLHLLGGVDTPTSGRVILDGTDIYALSQKDLAAFRRRQVALIYQFYNLLPMLNVRSNILLPLELDGRKVDERELAHILSLLGIADKEFHYPNQLSGGQQQRVAIARACITKPAILLADEPTGNLDSKNSADIMDLLSKANRELSQTIIMVTHDITIARRADRIIEMEDGKIVSDRIQENS